MLRSRIISLVALLALAGSLQAQTMADKVYLNAKVFTANDALPFAEAIAIKADTIVYVGTDAGVQAHVGSGTQVFDVGGQVLMPGLYDVHNHLLEASSDSWGYCALDGNETDPENYVSELQNCGLQPNTNGWLFAYGHSIETLLDATRPPRLILDDAYPSTPAVVFELTSHSVWVNTAALTLLNITSSTPDPVGGHIVKDTLGHPNGILLDNAGDAALSQALAANNTINNQNYDGLAYWGLEQLRKNGITAMVEGRTYWKRDYIETWQDIKADGLLTARVGLCLWGYPDDSDATLIPDLIALRDEGDDLIQITQVKVYSDGLLQNATAAMHDAYDHNHGWPFDHGLNYFDAARLASFITQLELQGFDFMIHAIGDRGVTEALDAIEAARLANGDIGARHRVTHCEIVDSADFGRFAQLNAIADMQVAGTWTNPAFWQDAAYLIGPQRADHQIPLRSLHDAGAMITLSSDFDVSPMNPFQSLEHAITRAPQDLPSLEEAIKAYTINGAYTMRLEEVSGSLEVGKYADLVVIDQDIFTINPSQIGNTNVCMTMLGGDAIYTTNCAPANVTSVDEHSALTSSLFPTITSGDVSLRIEGQGQTAMVRVLDSKGQLVKASSLALTPGTVNYPLDLSGLAEGMYLVEVQLDAGPKAVHRVIISR